MQSSQLIFMSNITGKKERCQLHINFNCIIQLDIGKVLDVILKYFSFSVKSVDWLLCLGFCSSIISLTRNNLYVAHTFRPNPDSPTKRLEVCKLGPPLLLSICGSWLREWRVPRCKAHSCCRSLRVHLPKVCYPASACTLCCVSLSLAWERIGGVFGLLSFLWVGVCCAVRDLSARSWCPVTGLIVYLALGTLWPTKPWRNKQNILVRWLSKEKII